MTACTFCGKAIEAGTGKLYIKRDATTYSFCSAKCQRNQVGLGRVNRHVKWTQAFSEHKSDRAAPTAKPAGEAVAAKPAKSAKKAAKATAE